MMPREIAFLAVAAAFILGYTLSNYDHASDARSAKAVITQPQPITQHLVVAAYLALPRQDKRDTLLYLNINNEIPHEAAKAIAEDWCAINKKTQRVCWNARMLNPIRGGK